MRIFFYMKDSRLGASPRHGGQEFFKVIDLQRGGIVGGDGVHRKS